MNKIKQKSYSQMHNELNMGKRKAEALYNVSIQYRK